MITAVVTIGDETTEVRLLGVEAGAPDRHVIPRGVRVLHRAHITADPPPPEDLTNAIGDMMDHLDDAARELPQLAEAERVVVAGTIAVVVAQVEEGVASVADEFVLTRDAAEDVFRTLATEATALRRRNPGLPAELVDVVVAGCCAVVAVFRSLHLDSVVVSSAPSAQDVLR